MLVPVPKQVLIADDSHLVRQTIKNVLAPRSDIAICGEATNGLEAVEKARTLKPDLVLLDLAMPEMNGAEAASVLKMTMPDVRIILFTMHSENIGSYLTSAIGVDAVLSKPEGITALVEAIDIALFPISGLVGKDKAKYVKPSVTTLRLANGNEHETEEKA